MSFISEKKLEIKLGEVIKDYSQAVYQANKVFRIVQPSAIQEERTFEINIPIYNDKNNQPMLDDNIKEFSDIKLFDFNSKPLCRRTRETNEGRSKGK